MPNVLILDCGATNLRAIAVNECGEIVASHHHANKTHSDPCNADYHIWDFEEIWEKLIDCAKHIIPSLNEKPIAIGVTTFGVDGAPYNDDAHQCAPIISWKCSRTVPVMESMDQWIDVEKLYQLNGIGQYSFNTLFKLRWLQKNRSDLYRKMKTFVFISSMITHRLTGELTTDKTMAGTSMMTNLNTRNWEDSVLSTLNLTKEHFPPMVEAGEKIGTLQPNIAKLLGLSTDTAVISCGHDTQFAILGSGAKLNQPVLSSGTWEILMARTETVKPKYSLVSQGLTTEFDAQKDIYNPAVQWIGSGMLEWLVKLLYQDVIKSPDYYSTIINEASQYPVGAHGINFSGNFINDTGDISGLSISTPRGAIYRSALEFLAKRLKCGLDVLQDVGNFKAQKLLCVGGGSKNTLWNQIRADVLNLPIEVTDVAESTVLGAAMTVFYGIGYYKDLSSAQQAMAPKHHSVMPSNNTALYQDWLNQ